MKKERRERVVVTDVFIAEDGQEFTTEGECRCHEQTIEEEKQHGIAERLPHFRYAPPITDDGVEYVWTYCETPEELNAVFVTYLCEEERSFYRSETIEEIPVPGWVVTASDDFGHGYIREAKKDLTDFLRFVNEVHRMMACGGEDEGIH